MAENNLLQRINAALKESVGGVAAERFGSAGRYLNSRLNDEKPESFRKILKRDFIGGATKNMGAIGRAIANKDGDKKSDRLTSNAIRSSSNKTSAEISEIKQQNSDISQSLESVNYSLKNIDAKLEDMLLSQERIEIVINRLLYKKEPPPVIEQTVNNVTNNVTNNNTNNNSSPLNNQGGRRNRRTPGGATPGGSATPRSLSPGAALGLGAAGGAAVGVAGAAAVGAAGGGSTGSTQGSGSTQNPSTANTVTPGSNLTSSNGNAGGRPYQQDARPVSGNAATQEAMQFFQSKGWTKEQAAGIVGNLQTESGNFAPDVISGRRKGDGGKAVGVAQWHPPRQANFQRVMGKPVEGSSLKEQLEFVNWELNNTEKRAGNILRTMSDAAQAAEAVDKFYERSNGAHRNQRISNARALAGGQSATQTPSSGSSPTAPSAASGGTTSSPTAPSTASGGTTSSPTAPSTGEGGEAQWWRQTPRNESGVPTQTMSGVLPQYPSQTRGGGSDTQAMYPQDRSGGPAPWQGSRPQQGGMTTLKTASGKSFTVAAQYADKFKGFVDALEGSGYKINSIGGFANRSTASGGFSWHSKGMAIDINPSENPHTFPGSQNYGKTDMPSNIRELAARFGLGWGGDWRSSKDTMHFSAGGNEGGSGTEARGGTMASTGENESRPGPGGSSSSPMPGGKVAGTGPALGNYGPMQGGGMSGSMPGAGMMGGRGIGQIGMGGGLGSVGGMIGGMLGGRSGPAGGILGSVLGNAIGNMAERAMMPTPVQQPIRTGADLGSRSSERSESGERYNRPRSNGPQNTPSHTTPSSKRFGVDEIPTVTPTGGFAEVLGSGIAGALVESLGSNSISVNRRQRAGSLVS
jgi:hypothetical protein